MNGKSGAEATIFGGPSTLSLSRSSPASPESVQEDEQRVAGGAAAVETGRQVQQQPALRFDGHRALEGLGCWPGASTMSCALRSLRPR